MTMSSAVKSKIVEQLETLPENLQQQVLMYLQGLQHVLPLALTRGVPGRQLLKFAGSIPVSDLESMRNLIENGCEQVNSNDW